MNDSSFEYTYWDVSNWTDEMKTQFQKKCFELGYKWFGHQEIVSELDAGRYYLNKPYITWAGGQYESRSHRTEKLWEDMFPEEEAQPVTETLPTKQELTSRFITFFNDEAASEDIPEWMEGFEDLVYVQPDIIGASVPLKNLTQAQLDFICGYFNLATPYKCKTHFSCLRVGDRYFSTPAEYWKANFNLSFNDIFKHKDKLCD